MQEGELAESSLRCKARKAASVSVTITGGMLPMAAEVAASRFALAHHESDLVMQASKALQVVGGLQRAVMQ